MDIIEEKIPEKKKPSGNKKIPDYLIYEIMDGEPIYYKGYMEVVKGKNTLEGIIGSSGLQAVILHYILSILHKNLNEDAYYFATNELGLHINLKNNLSSDIAIYESKSLTPDQINTKYAVLPPLIDIQIDTKADLNNVKHVNYLNKKTKKLLDFGAKKVIWILTETKQVMTATNDENWQIMNWDKDIDLLKGLNFNIAQYLHRKGITV